jgi:hypothetical protein
VGNCPSTRSGVQHDPGVLGIDKDVAAAGILVDIIARSSEIDARNPRGVVGIDKIDVARLCDSSVLQWVDNVRHIYEGVRECEVCQIYFDQSLGRVERG